MYTVAVAVVTLEEALDMAMCRLQGSLAALAKTAKVEQDTAALVYQKFPPGPDGSIFFDSEDRELNGDGQDFAQIHLRCLERCPQWLMLHRAVSGLDGRVGYTVDITSPAGMVRRLSGLVSPDGTVEFVPSPSVEMLPLFPYSWPTEESDRPSPAVGREPTKDELDDLTAVLRTLRDQTAVLLSTGQLDPKINIIQYVCALVDEKTGRWMGEDKIAIDPIYDESAPEKPPIRIGITALRGMGDAVVAQYRAIGAEFMAYLTLGSVEFSDDANAREQFGHDARLGPNAIFLMICSTSYMKVTSKTGTHEPLVYRTLAYPLEGNEPKKWYQIEGENSTLEFIDPPVDTPAGRVLAQRLASEQSAARQPQPAGAEELEN